MLKARKLINYIAIPSLLLLLSLAIFYLKIFNELLFPNPLDVATAFLSLFTSYQILKDFSITFLRVIISLILSAIIGIFFGIFLGYFERLYLMCEFLLDFFRSMPAPVLYPVFLLFFGIGDISKIMLSVFIAVLFILVSTSAGVRHSNKVHYNMSRIYQTSRKYRFFNIILMGASPYIFSGIRIGTSVVIISVMVAEMFIGSVSGLGHAILNAQLMYNIPQMYALIILTGAFGYLLNKILFVMEKKMIHWT